MESRMLVLVLGACAIFGVYACSAKTSDVASDASRKAAPDNRSSNAATLGHDSSMISIAASFATEPRIYTVPLDVSGRVN